MPDIGVMAPETDFLLFFTCTTYKYSLRLVATKFNDSWHNSFLGYPAQTDHLKFSSVKAHGCPY